MLKLDPMVLFRTDVLLDGNASPLLLATDEASGKSKKEEEGWVVGGSHARVGCCSRAGWWRPGARQVTDLVTSD